MPIPFKCPAFLIDLLHRITSFFHRIQRVVVCLCQRLDLSDIRIGEQPIIKMGVCLVQPIGHISPGGDLALDGAQGQVMSCFAFDCRMYTSFR